jgi:superfamily II DNA or RNA helicase
MLKDLELRHDYRSGRDALLEDFYIPCLEEAITYDRAVGFFSSSLLHVVAIAFSDFVLRDGHMRLICSPALTIDDFNGMKEGMESAARAQEVVREELEALLRNPEAIQATRLLATLVSADFLEIQIAFLENSPGIFHDKLGIFRDGNGRSVSFVGSANETFAAWGLNHESFEVFCSWRGESELLRTRRHGEEFEKLWNNQEPGVRIEGLNQVTKDRLREVSEPDIDTAIDRVKLRVISRAPARSLMAHQRAVLECWHENGEHGIVAFATGVGKTLTALSAIKEWTASGRPALVIVPGQDLHRQWLAEIALEIPEASPLKCGAGADSSTWRELLPHYTGAAHVGEAPRITLVTNATFASPDFQARLDDGPHLLVVGDEIHRLGSKANLAALRSIEAGGTLGLSATYKRQFDESGTADLLAWFGEVLDPVVGLAEGILIGLLVPYDYRLHTLCLEADELQRYEELTERIRKASAVEGSGSEMSDYLQMLLIQRGRVMKQARGKVDAAISILLKEFKTGERWLVYCDDLGQLNTLISSGLDNDLPVMEFHSTMKGDREAVLRSLSAHGGIVVAIRCLDEGVDIPTCDQALILASSTVEREYIQRRGRVLRSAPDKVSATIHDLLLIDDHGGVLARSEAVRALEFARLSRNPAARAALQLLLALSPDFDLNTDVDENLEDEVLDS